MDSGGQASNNNAVIKDKAKNKEYLIQEDIKRLKKEYADVIGKQEDLTALYKT